MDLQEYQNAANAIFDNVVTMLRERGVEVTGEPTTGNVIAALLPQCAFHAPGSALAANPLTRNEFDNILESFSAHITALMLTFGAQNLPAAFDKVPGLPGGV